jgi:hypothetical protein
MLCRAMSGNKAFAFLFEADPVAIIADSDRVVMG